MALQEQYRDHLVDSLTVALKVSLTLQNHTITNPYLIFLGANYPARDLAGPVKPG